MALHGTRARRTRRRRVAAIAAIATSLACAAPACLPSIAFDTSSPDGGTDAVAADVTPPSSDADGDAGSDARGDATFDGATDSADARPDGAAVTPPWFSAMASSSQPSSYKTAAACVVHDAGLYCWGAAYSNAIGALGFPDEDAGGTVGIPTPLQVTPTVAAPSEINQIVMNQETTCALFGATAYCWGSDNGGQLGDGNNQNMGGPNEVAVALPLGAVTSIAMASSAVCAVTPTVDASDESNVYCWGFNGNGELGRSASLYSTARPLPVVGEVDGGPLGSIPNAVQVAGGGSHFCALTNDRPTPKILCWGATDFLECGPVQGALTNPGGDELTYVIQPMQVTLPDSTEVPIELALGAYHSCALTEAGNVYCWGIDDFFEIGSTPSTQVCFDPPGSDAALACTGTPTKVAGVANIQHIFASTGTTCALDVNHHARCWGNNGEGELGTGNTATNGSPVEIVDSTTAIPYELVDMAIGEYSACGRTASDDVFCWGSGNLGNSADAAVVSDDSTPVLVLFLTRGHASNMRRGGARDSSWRSQSPSLVELAGRVSP